MKIVRRSLSFANAPLPYLLVLLVYGYHRGFGDRATAISLAPNGPAPNPCEVGR